MQHSCKLEDVRKLASATLPAQADVCVYQLKSHIIADHDNHRHRSANCQQLRS